ncbi:MAG: hypothetical protein HY835_04850 [Anaerolineae bacterium]|nr:hypothetical protein [Anaerolineae bacterium]
MSVALAHGEPIITVEPTVASPGEQITIIGADMEDGEVFKITLENASGTVELGEATAVKEGEEAGFTAAFTLPDDLTAGFYLLRAATDEGETVAADLTIVSSANQANDALLMEASGVQHTLDRSKPPLLIGSVIVLALLSAGLGLRLVLMRE